MPKPAVFVVSHNLEYSIRAKEFIEDEGYTVLLPHSSPDAIATVHELFSSAIYLIDYDLDDMNGIRLANYIKEIKRFPVLSILIYDTEVHEVLAEGLRQPGVFSVFVRNPSTSGSLYNFGVLLAAYLAHAESFLRDSLAPRIDFLTGAYDRVEGNRHWETEWLRIRRTKRAMSCIFIDLDGLKSANNTHGHLVGDELLREVAKAMRHTVRSNDFIIRYGGDEFVLILPETTRREARDVLSRIRRLADMACIKVGGEMIPVSFSAGISSLNPRELGGGAEEDFEKLVRRADALMYRDKRARKRKASAN